MAGHAGAAAIGNEGNIVLFGILKQGLDIQGRLRIGNTIGKYAKVAAALKNCGVTKGDRVAGVLPNVCETVIAMLASASLGAIWSS